MQKVKGSELNTGDYFLHEGLEYKYQKPFEKAFSGTKILEVSPDEVYNVVAITEVRRGPRCVVATKSGKVVGNINPPKTRRISI